MIDEQNEEAHICTDTHGCEIDSSDEHLVLSESIKPSSTPTVKKNIPMRSIALAVVAVIVLAGIGLAGFVYTHSASDKTVQKITQNVPFPAFMIGRSFITYAQYYEERDALTKYFASQQEGTEKPTGDQFTQLVVDTLTNKAVVRTLASNYGLTLDPSKVEAFYQNILTSSAGEETFKKQLQDTFGWSIADFKRRIVEPVVLSQQVNDSIVASKTVQQPERDLIDQARARVSGGEDFATVADEVHAKAKVTLKSDLGLMKTSDLPAAWADKVKGLEKGNVSDVIDLPQGYALFMVTDRTGKENDEQIHLFAMTVPKVSLQTVVADYLKNVKVKKWIKA